MFQIRLMQLADHRDVQRLCSELGYPGKADDLRGRILEIRANPYHEAFVAETTGGRVVGLIHLYEVPSLLTEPTAELGGLIVATEARLQGVGAALMRAAEQWSRQRGKHSLLLATRWDRAGAKNFYAKLGFLVDYDATYLRKTIDSPQILQHVVAPASADMSASSTLDASRIARNKESRYATSK